MPDADDEDVEMIEASDETEAIEEMEASEKKPKKKMGRPSTIFAHLPERVRAVLNNATENSDKFVDLLDLLPPLPQKGSFDVKTIKKSLYFFS